MLEPDEVQAMLGLHQRGLGDATANARVLDGWLEERLRPHRGNAEVVRQDHLNQPRFKARQYHKSHPRRRSPPSHGRSDQSPSCA